jgi:hypothetical protein
MPDNSDTERTFPHGGRIWDVCWRGSERQITYSGRYEGPVTAEDIIAFCGDGTFGHKAPRFCLRTFYYTIYED